jgi:outer membrane protein assembly factor BamB
VVWGGQVWLTTATKDGRELFALCVDRDTGRVVHDVKVFAVAKPEKIAAVNSYASPTPAIEEGRIYVHFGTYGTACLDTRTGAVLWERRDLSCDHHMGPGASPILLGNLLILTVDGCDVQYVVALDKATGKTVWKTDRAVDYSKINRLTRKAFCTPAVIDWRGRMQLISPCSRAIFAYDAETGKELWKATHRGWSMTPRPLFGHGLLYIIIDYDFPELWAMRPDGQGDVTETHVAWKIPRDKHMPSMSSLLLTGELLFTVSDKGVASCISAKTGGILWWQKLGGQYAASPIHADGRVYLFADDGTCKVIEPALHFKLLATNKLDGKVMASPAAAGKAFFIRTETHLYRVEGP